MRTEQLHMTQRVLADTPRSHERSVVGETPLPGRELYDLLAPVTPDTFLQEYWQVKPLYIQGTPDKFRALFDRQRFYACIHRASALRHVPSFRLGAIIPPRDDEPLTPLTFTETVQPEEVDTLLAAGITICVNDISAADSQLAAFAHTIKSQMAYLGHVRFNCYVSGDGSGADTHFDARVATTLQIEGRKRWRFSARPALAWPRANAQLQQDGTPVWMSPWIGTEPWERLERVDEASFTEVILEPGDVLCLPAGTWHNAKAIGESLALNITFSPMNFVSLLTKILETAFVPHAGWRGSPPPVYGAELPPGKLPAQVEQYLVERLQELRAFLDTLDLQGPCVPTLWRELVEH